MGRTMEDLDTAPVRDEIAGTLENPEASKPQQRDELAEQKKRCED